MLKVTNHMHHPTQPKKDFNDFQRIRPKHQVLLRSLGGIFLSPYSQFAGLAVETPSLSGRDGSDGSKGSDGSEGKLFFRGWPDRISTITERWFSNWFSRSWQMVDRSLKWFHPSALSHPSRCSFDINSCISWEELAIIAIIDYRDIVAANITSSKSCRIKGHDLWTICLAFPHQCGQEWPYYVTMLPINQITKHVTI